MYFDSVLSGHWLGAKHNSTVATEVMMMAVAVVSTTDWDNEGDNDDNNYYNN